MKPQITHLSTIASELAYNYALGHFELVASKLLAAKSKQDLLILICLLAENLKTYSSAFDISPLLDQVLALQVLHSVSSLEA